MGFQCHQLYFLSILDHPCNSPSIVSLLMMWCTGESKSSTSRSYCSGDEQSMFNDFCNTISPVSGAQPVLTQPPSAMVSSQSIVKLSCLMSTGSRFSISGYHMNWFQQNPGNPLQYLCSCWWPLQLFLPSKKRLSNGLPSRQLTKLNYSQLSNTLLQEKKRFQYVLFWSQN